MVSREQAIEIATARVSSDSVMSLDGRDTVAEFDGGTWHVSFPFSDTVVRGGEPHVYVDAETGEVTRAVYTQ